VYPVTAVETGLRVCEGSIVFGVHLGMCQARLKCQVELSSAKFCVPAFCVP
jgi:hypothetical protein